MKRPSPLLGSTAGTRKTLPFGRHEPDVAFPRTGALAHDGGKLRGLRAGIRSKRLEEPPIERREGRSMRGISRW